MRNSDAIRPNEQELVITRIFDAPRELVFKAWTDPRHVAHWWGPGGFTVPMCELDVRPGGVMRIHMQGPDSIVHTADGVYHEVIRPERLVFTTRGYPDDAGEPRLEVIHTVTFVDHEGGKTKLTLRAAVVKATPEVAEALAGMDEGWSQALDKLAAYVRP